MGKDILTPNKIQSNDLTRDYSTPKAHCDLGVMQKAERRNNILKLKHTGQDEDVIAMMDEKQKMYQEGILTKPKPKSHNQEWSDIEEHLINKFDSSYLDKRGHKRTRGSLSNKDGDKEYFVNTVLLAKIVAMHPLISGVHTLVTICDFHKTIYYKISTSKGTGKKAITKKQLQQIAEVLSLEDWETLVDKTAIKRKETIRAKMESYKEQIKRLEEELSIIEVESDE